MNLFILLRDNLSDVPGEGGPTRPRERLRCSPRQTACHFACAYAEYVCFTPAG